jgi:hypothetical protein
MSACATAAATGCGRPAARIASRVGAGSAGRPPGPLAPRSAAAADGRGARGKVQPAAWRGRRGPGPAAAAASAAAGAARGARRGAPARRERGSGGAVAVPLRRAARPATGLPGGVTPPPPSAARSPAASAPASCRTSPPSGPEPLAPWLSRGCGSASGTGGSCRPGGASTSSGEGPAWLMRARMRSRIAAIEGDAGRARGRGVVGGGGGGGGGVAAPSSAPPAASPVAAAAAAAANPPRQRGPRGRSSGAAPTAAAPAAAAPAARGRVAAGAAAASAAAAVGPQGADAHAHGATRGRRAAPHGCPALLPAAAGRRASGCGCGGIARRAAAAHAAPDGTAASARCPRAERNGFGPHFLSSGSPCRTGCVGGGDGGGATAPGSRPALPFGLVGMFVWVHPTRRHNADPPRPRPLSAAPLGLRRRSRAHRHAPGPPPSRRPPPLTAPDQRRRMRTAYNGRRAGGGRCGGRGPNAPQFRIAGRAGAGGGARPDSGRGGRVHWCAGAASLINCSDGRGRVGRRGRRGRRRGQVRSAQAHTLKCPRGVLALWGKQGGTALGGKGGAGGRSGLQGRHSVLAGSGPVGRTNGSARGATRGARARAPRTRGRALGRVPALAGWRPRAGGRGRLGLRGAHWLRSGARRPWAWPSCRPRRAMGPRRGGGVAGPGLGGPGAAGVCASGHMRGRWAWLGQGPGGNGSCEQ